MLDRSALGRADVTDEELASMVAALLGTSPSQTMVLDCVAEEVAYDVPAMTTAGRFWVRGTAEADLHLMPFELFVKTVQSWSRSPLFQLVPPEFQAASAAAVPWRTEPLVYRSDLRDRLPTGLTMPACFGVFDLDDQASSVWLEVVQIEPVVWDRARYSSAAQLLGRLAGSPRVRELARVGGHEFHVRDYLSGRLEVQVVPMLHDHEVWAHPLVSEAYDAPLRARLLRAADRVADLVEELGTFPTATSHGDSCPNNLLVRAGTEGFVLIDYGFWNLQPVGFDLAQLLVGDVQLGYSPAAELRERDDAIVPAYLAGLLEEGFEVEESDLRRAHALQLLLFTGLSTIPVEHLGAAASSELRQLAGERAALSRFSLDLLDATE